MKSCVWWIFVKKIFLRCDVASKSDLCVKACYCDVPNFQNIFIFRAITTWFVEFFFGSVGNFAVNGLFAPCMLPPQFLNTEYRS